MDDLISRAAAIEAALDGADDWDGGYSPSREEYIRKHMEEVPAVNAAPVVRCFQCKHWKCFGDAEDGDYDIGTCELYNQGFGAECFCSNGERRDDDAAD